MKIQRTPAGLGIILKTTQTGNPVVETAQGAAAQAGVLPGAVILACCGVAVAGRGERAVVDVIKGLPPGAPVELVLEVAG